MASSLPAFDNVRLAQPADIERMGSVTIAGFHTSSSFAWQHPYYAEHKLEALRSQRHMYRDVMMKSMNHVLLVIEDTYDPAENEQCPEVITSEDNETMPNTGDKVVVGVAMIELPKTSERIGQFQNTKAIEIDLPEKVKSESLDDWHLFLWNNKEAAAKDKYFKKDLYLSLLVVHPAYGRRGHGANLIKWGIQLAITDRLNLGLVASEVANPLYKRLGFEFLEKFELQGDETSENGIHYEVLKWSHKEDKIVEDRIEGDLTTSCSDDEL